MNKAIEIANKFCSFLSKFNLENHLDIDFLLDNNFPELVAKFQAYSNEEKIAFCASSGKRTITHLFNQIIEASNKTVVTNVSDNAEKNPFLTSVFFDFIKSNKFFEDNIKKDYFTIASDFDETFKNFKIINFDILLLNNIFNSQLDFSTNYEKKRKIQSAIVLNSKLNLVINADDPNFFDIDNIKNDVNLTQKRNKFYYGFDEIEVFDASGSSIQYSDIIRCPRCGCELNYRKRFYSHIGIYDCECGFRRPNLNLSATAKIFPDYSFLTVFYNSNKMVFKLPFGSVYNAYNALGAIALALALKIDRKTIASAFEGYKPLKGRDEVVIKNNKRIKIKVFQNSTALSENLQELFLVKNKKLLFCFDSNFEDGIDTSWIWDSNLAVLNNFENKVYVTGKRFDDMALRLKYAGVNPSLITMDNSVKSAISACFYALEEGEEMMILTVPSLLDEVCRHVAKY